jgi:hypothetical protein
MCRHARADSKGAWDVWGGGLLGGSVGLGGAGWWDVEGYIVA